MTAAGLRFGILLPGVSPASGSTVEVPIIHADDQFLQDIPPSSVALHHGSLAPRGDFWSASLTSGDPFFARSGQSVSCFRVTRLLPDGSVLSPDASLVREERWQALSPTERRTFPPLCPDLVVEPASPSDAGPLEVTSLRRKMGLYQANGARRSGWRTPPGRRPVGGLRAWCWSWSRSRARMGTRRALVPRRCGWRALLT